MKKSPGLTFPIFKWVVFWVVLFALIGWVIGARVATAQLPPGAIAVTSCLGGHVKSAVDVEVIGTDSLDEILIHEAKHREQAKRVAPDCPRYTYPYQLLNDEVEAYCASKQARMKRGYTEQEVSVNYIARLIYQFKGAMPRRDIVQSFWKGCPPTEVVIR